ncbi:OVARIAN TUMOR DOMAIN-containing deubiquitinating enzyme 3 [Dionaea muscipula]
MMAESSNATILGELRNGTAHFEMLSPDSPHLPVLGSSPIPNSTMPRGPSLWSQANSVRFFARIGPPPLASPALKKVEQYGVQKINGDGRCMFRALVRGMARNKGMALTPREERQDADDLRLAVKEVICDDESEQHHYKEALIAITVDEPLKRYCRRIERDDFWGGESELLVLSKLCKQPIVVYIPEHEHTKSRGSGFIPIAEYGAEYGKGSGKREARDVVRLLYSGRNHYDLLV